MATSFSTLRSPVMSIRTEPAEEDSLRAEIEAATRTQHEILPRHSWHSGLTKKDTSKQTRVSAHKNNPSSQMERTHTIDDDGSMFAEYASMSPGAVKDALSFLRSTSATTRPWRQLTKRIKTRHSPSITTQPDSPVEGTQRTSRRHKKVLQKPHRDYDDGMVADENRAAQHAQFHAWLEEKFEEQNSLANLSSSPAHKTKRTVRKSVYGSLTSTKSFLKGASKNPLEKLRNCNIHPSSSTPHVNSFENKDQLREYLNHVPSASPMSPLDPPRQVLSVADGIEPVELSAGPIPAELDGTNTDPLATQQPSVSRISSPSIPDLPPYIDDKKFRADIAKDQSLQTTQSGDKPPQTLHGVLEASYLCGSCKKSIQSCDVYDFCSVCDTSDRVLCNECARRGPCCQHELEGLLRACALGQAAVAQPRHAEGAPEVEHVPDRLQRPINHQSVSLRAPGLSNEGVAPVQSIPLGRAPHPSFMAEANVTNGQQDIMKEMNNLQREHDLMHRERELALRMREIELRDQQITLREREARTDLLLRNLESIVAGTKMPAHTFIGAQFQTQGIADTQSVPQVTNTVTPPSQPSHDIHSNLAQRSGSTLTSAHDILHHDASVKSNAAQKRKKEVNTAGGSTTSSTPAAASSSDNPHKPLSRGNSERDTSQDEDEEEGNQRHPKKNKQDTPSLSGPRILFACPFSKNNPQRFSSRNVAEKNYRGCGNHYLPDVSRLKQHLKRVHWQPEIYCPRCYEEFTDPVKLTEHARAQDVCRAKPCPFPEKMDKAKQEKIHTKRPRVPPDTVWYDIYKVLFPGAPLPESPYAEERVVTPLSAAPLSSAKMDAVQMLSNIFNHRLNQHDAMQNNPLRSIIQHTLTESFTELLASYSISPCASPSAGPSIMISPVSRLSSDEIHMPGSPFASPYRPLQPEYSNAAPSMSQQPPKVPQLQQPPLRLKTALQVPKDHHRSPVGHSRSDSAGSVSPADFIFDINIMSHVQDDPGYDDECRSFEQGDDLQAMGIANEHNLPACRTKSVMSLDSGYGSGRSHHHQSHQSAPATTTQVQQQSSHLVNDTVATEVLNTKPEKTFSHSDFAPLVGSNLFTQPISTSEDYYGGNFMSYSSFLDPNMSQDIMGSDDLLFSGQSNPWNYP